MTIFIVTKVHYHMFQSLQLHRMMCTMTTTPIAYWCPPATNQYMSCSQLQTVDSSSLVPSFLAAGEPGKEAEIFYFTTYA